MVKWILAALMLISSSAFAHYNSDNIFKTPGEYIVEYEYKNYHLDLLDMKSKDVEILGVNFKDKTIDLFLNKNEMRNMMMLGYKLRIKERPSLMLAPDQEYKSPDEIAAFLRNMAETYPNLTKLVSIGKSVQGRDIWAIKISDNPSVDEAQEPSILFNSMHHAREVMTPEVGWDIVEYLLTNYGNDEKVTHWVDSNEIWVVPMLNVDGSNKVWNGSSMWRKNVANGYGVDINRNYPYKWGSCNGSSGSTWSQTYRGPTAGSEPETKALMGLVSQIKPVFNISYHSYSELVLYPYGCRGEKTRIHEVVSHIGSQLGTALDYKPGTPWEILYGVDGGDIDWMHAVEQVIPYVMEVNSSREGFQPRYDLWRDKTVKRNRAGWQLLLDRLDGAGVRGTLKNASGEQIKEFEVHVFKNENGRYKPFQEYRSNPDGTYHIVLKEGSYRFQFKAGFRGSLSTEAVLTGERLNLDAQLPQ